MAGEANLLVTFDPTHQATALKEIETLLGEVKEKGKVLKAEEGVAEVVVGNPKKAVKQLATLAKKDIEKFNYTYHWIPIEKWCKATVEEMQKTVKSFVKDIKETERWKMDLKIRKVKKKPDELKLVIKLTDVVDRPKVDLKNPEKIIKVEIIGNKAGLSLLMPDEYLNVAKSK